MEKFSRSAFIGFCLSILFFLVCQVKASAAEPRESTALKIATWNIQVGADEGIFPNNWKKRKLALIPALKAIDADVLCTQEGRLEQLRYIDKNFPDLARLGVGRDDGKDGGEFCAIYYRKDRLEVLKSGTFWLSDKPDLPLSTWDGPYKRICTHALFKDKINGTRLVILSTHFPLNPLVQPKAARLVSARILKMYEGLPTLLCGDFNCEPGSKPWKEFEKAYLEPVDAGKHKTYHVNGLATLCLDSIFKSEDIRATDFKILDKKYGGVYPSDHFGLMIRAAIPDVN